MHTLLILAATLLSPPADARTLADWNKMPIEERAAYNEATSRVTKGHDVYVSTGVYISTPYVDVVYCPSGVPGLDANSVYRCYVDEKGEFKAQKQPATPTSTTNDGCSGGRCPIPSYIIR